MLKMKVIYSTNISRWIFCYDPNFFSASKIFKATDIHVMLSLAFTSKCSLVKLLVSLHDILHGNVFRVPAYTENSKSFHHMTTFGCDYCGPCQLQHTINPCNAGSRCECASSYCMNVKLQCSVMLFLRYRDMSSI